MRGAQERDDQLRQLALQQAVHAIHAHSVTAWATSEVVATAEAFYGFLTDGKAEGTE